MLSTAAPVRLRGASSALAFSLARFKFTLRPAVGLSLPPYKGATLRGGFGYAFKDLVCIKPDRQCKGCLVQDRCSYFQIFETPVPKDATIMRKYPFAPHPFVFTPPLTEQTEFTKDDELTFELTLIGRAVDYLPYFIYAFDELGRRGIGRAKSKFHLLRVDALSPYLPSDGRDASLSDAATLPHCGTHSEIPESSPALGDPLASVDLSARIGDDSAVWQPIYDASAKTLARDIPLITFSDLALSRNLSLVDHRLSLPPESALSTQDFSLPHGSSLLALRFLTPVRIFTGGKLDHELSFTSLMKSLLRRIRLLQFFHSASSGEDVLTIDETRRLLRRSESVLTVSNEPKHRAGDVRTHATISAAFFDTSQHIFPEPWVEDVRVADRLASPISHEAVKSTRTPAGTPQAPIAAAIEFREERFFVARLGLLRRHSPS